MHDALGSPSPLETYTYHTNAQAHEQLCSPYVVY